MTTLHLRPSVNLLLHVLPLGKARAGALSEGPGWLQDQ